MKNVLTLGILTALIGCAPDPSMVEPSARAQPQSKAEISFAKLTLTRLQARSIAENVEFCGYIGTDGEGEFVATEALRGGQGSCQPQEPPAFLTVLASYHTHGAYSPDYDSEVPSYDDLSADILEQVDGYIATPGGRVWFNDASEKRARLLCTTSCIASDPNYQDDPDFPVANTYDLRGLRGRADLG